MGRRTEAGDTVRTGRNRRVLLKRGEESILIAPNSVVGVPAEITEGLSTTIVQRAGSILLDVEKRGSPSKPAKPASMRSVVKLRSQIFKSGQIAQGDGGPTSDGLRRRQGWPFATWLRHLCAIEQGKPRTSSIAPVPVPRGGLSANLEPSASRLLWAKSAGTFTGPRTALLTIRRQRMGAAATQLTKHRLAIQFNRDRQSGRKWKQRG
jgi:hypothetical protein